MHITRISPREAAVKLRDGWVYVDVRSEAEFVLAHPTGAVNVPFDRDSARLTVPAAREEEFIEAVKAAVGDPASAKLVLGCRSGVVSVHAAEVLMRAGFTNVLEQRAGFEGSRGTFGELREAGWEREGLPVARDSKEGS